QTGDFGGQVTATAAGVSVQTPFGVVRDVARAKVHVTATDRAGQPGSNTLTVLLNPETSAAYSTLESDATLTVIPGTYLAFSFVPDRQQSINLLVYPTLEITGDRELAMDGRLARGYDVTVPDKGAAPVGALVDVQFGNVGMSATVMGAGFGSLYSAHLGPKNAPGLLSMALGLFAKADGSGGFASSPSYYQTGWYSQGQMFDGLVRHLRERDLATVRAQYGFNAVGGQGTRTNFGVAPGSFGGWGFGVSAALPATRTEYFAGTLAWQPTFMEWPPGTEDAPLAVASGPTTSYAACCRYAEQWNKAVFGPNLVSPDPASPSVLRAGDDIIAFPALYADGWGRQGFAGFQAGRGALYRNGHLVAENPYPGGVFTVPAGAAQYRLEVRSEQVAALRLSTIVESVWTFNSAHVDKTAPLPVIGLRIAASLDERNTAPAGSFAVIPIIVSQQQGSDAGQVTKLAVDVSYDDGATWQKAQVVHALGKWLLALKHADRAGFVSLRAQATDSAGNTVQQTVIRAYELR
ncbi:MAG: hypothetical protein QOE61_1127, partial [Micromonosporaceae bacterium]|nr:hypothetical protein [Micromonosporaceae bacterium]